MIKSFQYGSVDFTGQYVYLGRPSMVTSAAERLMTDSCNKMTPLNTWPFKAIGVSPTTTSKVEDRF